MRNFDISLDNGQMSDFLEENGVSELKRSQTEGVGGEGRLDGCFGDSDSMNAQSLGNLSPQALNYIKQLESQLSNVKQGLDARKQENLQMEYVKKGNNDILKYLKSLEPDMVTELSRPSSSEVEDCIHHLAQNMLLRLFKEDIDTNCGKGLSQGSTES